MYCTAPCPWRRMCASQGIGNHCVHIAILATTFRKVHEGAHVRANGWERCYRARCRTCRQTPQRRADAHAILTSDILEAKPESQKGNRQLQGAAMEAEPVMPTNPQSFLEPQVARSNSVASTSLLSGLTFEIRAKTCQPLCRLSRLRRPCSSYECPRNEKRMERILDFSSSRDVSREPDQNPIRTRTGASACICAGPLEDLRAANSDAGSTNSLARADRRRPCRRAPDRWRSDGMGRARRDQGAQFPVTKMALLRSKAMSASSVASVRSVAGGRRFRKCLE